MSDAVVPSYRVSREPSGVPWRMLAVAGGLLGVVAVGAGGYWAVRSYGGGIGGVPVVEADPRPFKVRPDDPGGLRVPNQSELIMERPAQRTQLAAQQNRNPQVAPGAEAPDLSRLRAAVAPPAPRVEPQPVPDAPPVAQVLAPIPAPVPAASAPAVAQPLARPVPNGRVVVQLGALPTEESARAEWERLARRAPELFGGRTPQISRLEREGQGPLFRLRTGGMADQDGAAQFCEQVRARGGACVPVRS